MKINWGWGVVIAFLLFGAMILTMVIKSFDVPVNMVTKNYYAEEKGLEDKKASIANVNALSSLPVIQFSAASGNVNIQFPEEINNPVGQVRFFRPSDSRLDFTLNFELENEKKLEIPVANKVKGRWVVILDWKDQDKPYYFEKSIIL